jgi:hypothetical protein
MTVKVPRQKITQAIDALRWVANCDDTESALETRKRARQCGPDLVAFLHYVVRTDKFASAAQRVRAASTLLAVGEFLSAEARETGLFSADETDGSGAREAG